MCISELRLCYIYTRQLLKDLRSIKDKATNVGKLPFDIKTYDQVPRKNIFTKLKGPSIL